MIELEPPPGELKDGEAPSRRTSKIGRRRAVRRPWEERFAALYEDLRKPARVMVGRTYGRSFGPEDVEDVYASAWSSTLKALGGRERLMPDAELRSYVLTAVARHAARELRRRRRRPVQGLDEVHAETIADRTSTAPDEGVVGSESRAQVRDLLVSLPPRRRAVLLLRYGWGMDPEEICATISGLSPRAYRKEITRGVRELAERLEMQERGSWCESREAVLRDHVAGTGDEEASRQATHHLAHCRRCGDLVARLSEQLHELGGAGAWTLAIGGVGAQSPPGDRLFAAGSRVREQLGSVLERGEGAAEAATAVAASGGTRGAGAATGGGILTLLGGTGAKIAAVCGGAAATVACVGAVTLPTTLDPFHSKQDPPARAAQLAGDAEDRSAPAASPAPTLDRALAPSPAPADAPPAPAAPPPPPAAPEPEPAPEPPAAAPPAAVAEADPLAAAAPPAPAGGGGGGSGRAGGSSGGGGASEFGP